MIGKNISIEFAIYRAQSDLAKKCTFTNIIDQAKNNEMKVVGGWESELVKRELAKIAINALLRRLHYL